MINKKYINQQEDAISNYLRDVRKCGVIDLNKEVELAKKIQEGDSKALDELVTANLRFVISIAKEYQNQGIPLADLISEGNYGLMTAAKRFDHTKGFRFISYAVWWIKQSIIQSLNDNSRIVRLPTNVINNISKLKKDISYFEQKNGRKPIEGELDMSLMNQPFCTSLNETINEDGDEIMDIIPDNSFEKPDESFEKPIDMLKNELEKTLSILSDRERIIIEFYFGLKGKPLTLEEIGEIEEVNITKERVRQIKERAIRKLRDGSKNLFQFIEK